MSPEKIAVWLAAAVNPLSELLLANVWYRKLVPDAVSVPPLAASSLP
jgi:hypothetical protein